MPTNNEDLHGNVPENCAVALLLIDVINDMEFDGAEALVEQAVPMARRIAELKRRAKEACIPAIYVNDNFGRWKSDFRLVVEHCLNDHVRGEPVARILQPADDDYFVLKPKHSAFYATTLDTLLTYLGARTLILTGIAGNICILFSANDAYMRDLNIFVPSDCVVSNTPGENEHALEQMQKVLKADITPSPDLDLEEMLRWSSEQQLRR
ncbi:cysteine hydrolase [Geomonas sp. RF6]|uniref:cysteine hydrolase family protein n=1 Tax=Geomonas sp. RF6 TaxID=2897342 RepID=UPI001E56D606|nr:isochorismatase family cysteine hydrolase [Geomonas sp. RF6]UFS68996.1 cysteine hydrolase [Geomonas sp. RF6]